MSLISSMRLDGIKGIQPVKLAWLSLHSQLEDHALPLLEGTDKVLDTQQSL